MSFEIGLVLAIVAGAVVLFVTGKIRVDVGSGYRFTDYIRVGAPLTLWCLLVVRVVLPLFWPLEP